MASKNPKLVGEGNPSKYPEAELEHREGDRIYFLAVIMDKVFEVAQERIIPVEDPLESFLDGAAMEMIAALGRFGLAMMDKTGDLIAELDTVFPLIEKMATPPARKSEAVSID
jgi:hypothetical protein